MTNETILDAIGMIDDDAVYDTKAWQSESEQEKRVRWIGRKFGVLMLAEGRRNFYFYFSYIKS